MDREKQDNMDHQDRDEIYSKVIRAGKRTYFFDVKATRSEDYYLTITESKKVFDADGNSHYEKHKIFLYKEDFDKFATGLSDVIEYIRTGKAPDRPESFSDTYTGDGREEATTAPRSIEFEDLTADSDNR